METELTNVSANIDEFTIVIFAKIGKSKIQYVSNVKKLIDEIDNKFKLSLFYGTPDEIGLKGYNCSYSFDSKVLFGYHNKLSRQGLMFRFTSSGLDELTQRLGVSTLDIVKTLNDIIENNRDIIDKYHFSRIDYCIDFVDYSYDNQTYVTVNDIFARYTSDESECMIVQSGRTKADNPIFRRFDKNSVETYGMGGRIDTIEFGNRQSVAMLRIYNKKQEQLTKDKDARYLGTATNCESWVRMELQCMKTYAKAMFDELVLIDEDNFTDFIANLVYNRYHFATLVEQNKKTHELILQDWEISDFIKNELAQNDYEPIRSTSKVDNDIMTKFEHYFGDKSKSGVVGYLAILRRLYGKDAFDMLMDNIKEQVEQYELTKNNLQYMSKMCHDLPDYPPYLSKDQRDKLKRDKELRELFGLTDEKRKFDEMMSKPNPFI